MINSKWLIRIICLALSIGSRTLSAQAASNPEAQAAELRAKIEATPILPLNKLELSVKLPAAQQPGMISWLAYDSRHQSLWLIQRGDKADPIIEVDMQGHVLRSFGRGLFKVPHSIRLDSNGNLWTVDAGSSRVIEFNAKGEKLLHFDLPQPAKHSDNGFSGATDIAFAPNGRILISDGYVNARILEYTAQGKPIAAWGTAGSGAGQFHLPHSVVVDKSNIVYVADRENARIEKFDLDGKYLGEIDGLGRVYSLALGRHGTLWATTAPLNLPPGSPGWIIEMDPKTGRILGHVSVNAEPALHCLDMVS
jgi:sugar lactone lactonase YvrE